MGGIPEIQAITSNYNSSYFVLLFFVKFPHICLPFGTLKVLSVKLCLTFPGFIAQRIKFMLQPFSQFDNISNSYLGRRKVHVGQTITTSLKYVEWTQVFHASLPPLTSQTLRTPASLTQQPKRLILVGDLVA